MARSVAVWLLGAALLENPAALAAPRWSAPARLFETTADIYEPVIVVDPSAALHLAWSMHDERSTPPAQQICVTRFDGSAWSVPIALGGGPTANAPSLAADPFGDLHLVWHGLMARLQYTWARAADATNTAAWARHVALTESNMRAQVLADADGGLHLAYPARDAGGVMYRASTDGGATWSAPRLVASTAGPHAAADFTRIAIGPQRTLHVVWTEFEFPQAWPPRGVFHARSTDGGRTWSAPTELAGNGFDQVSIALVDDQTIHVAWNGMAGVWGRYHRWSSDGGATWSAANQLFSAGGTEGPPPLLVDAARRVHLITTHDSSAWHMVWDGAAWSSPECISCGVDAGSGLLEEPTAVIREGDQLHVAFWRARHQVWHMAAQLDAPHRPSPPVRVAGWWSERTWRRHAGWLRALLAIGAALGLAATWAVCRRRRDGGQA